MMSNILQRAVGFPITRCRKRTVLVFSPAVFHRSHDATLHHSPDRICRYHAQITRAYCDVCERRDARCESKIAEARDPWLGENGRTPVQHRIRDDCVERIRKQRAALIGYSPPMLQSREARLDDDDIVIANLDGAADVEAASHPLQKAFSEPLPMFPHDLKRGTIIQLHQRAHDRLYSVDISTLHTRAGRATAENRFVCATMQGARALYPQRRASRFA